MGGLNLRKTVRFKRKPTLFKENTMPQHTPAEVARRKREAAARKAKAAKAKKKNRKKSRR